VFKVDYSDGSREAMHVAAELPSSMWGRERLSGAVHGRLRRGRRAGRGTRDAAAQRMSIRAAAMAVLAVMACARTSTTTTTWVASGNWTRTGTVESVQEVVRRVEGEPAAGALVGALIGGFLFRGDGPATLFGAATGAAIGAAVSEGSAEYRTYQVLIHFDDGTRGLFLFRDYSPFTPGERVTLTPQGLHAG
jgi:outer membrane lipoprotein SlyB